MREEILRESPDSLMPFNKEWRIGLGQPFLITRHLQKKTAHCGDARSELNEKK